MFLKKQTGVNVVLIGKVNNLRMDVISQNEPVSQILQKIASSKNLVVVRNDSMNYELMDEQTYQKEKLPKMAQRKIFILKHIKAEDARKALQNVLTKGIGQMAADPRTNKLIITDLPQVIELIKRLLDEIDVQLIWRAFYIRHADVAAIADKLKNYKSGPGTIEVDPKTHQIIVYDIFQNIKRMEMLVEVLDVGPEMRVYNLNNIGVDGKIAQQLSKAIEQVITKDADVFWQIDDRSGTLVVQDVPEVHEKIEQILAALDQPVKQVLIYAEMVDTSFNKSYDFGIRWDASEDFFSAARDGLFTVPTGTSGDLTNNMGFLNLHEEFPTFSMDGSQLLVGYLNKYFRANLNAALTKSDTRILLQPRFIVKNQEEVKVKVGGSKPYRTTNYYTDNRWQSSGQASISYGLEVTMKPSISNNGLIEMEIEISNSDASFIGDVNENPLVEKTEVSAKTILVIPSGETRVLAGLINNNDTDTRNGIPFLVEIPIIGPALFGKKSERDTRRNILFFVTPTLIEERPTNKDFYRGKSVQDLVGEGEMPSYLDELTSASLTGKKTGDSEDLSQETAPSLSSDKPVELQQLLAGKANLDLDTLRQERMAVTIGPEGEFSSTSAPSSPPPPSPSPRTVAQRGEQPKDEPPPEPKDDKGEEETPSEQYKGEQRPYRPAPPPETKY
jgi:type II secretory pathway component GspD/PulD (secretin)